MKIIATARTRNESKNIDRFCQAYTWADAILIADGGSEDDTIERAMGYANTKIRQFGEKVHHNGVWRNPHGRHINFLIDWAKEEGADWIIFDDCDCVPTKVLQKYLKSVIFENTESDLIYLYRLYVWGTNRYFPDLNKPGQSLYAWRSSVDVRADESNPWQHHIEIPDAPILRLDLPYCCLHHFAPDEGTVQRKLVFYVQAEIPDIRHPLAYGGQLEPLPEWAK